LLMCLGGGYAAAGKTVETRQLLEELETRSRATYISPCTIGTLHLALGEIDQSLKLFIRGVEDRDPLTILIKNDSFYDPLRSQPSFQAILRKANLEP